AIAREINVVLFNETYHCESRRVLATLIRLLGDFDLAEEALQEALKAGAEQWSRDGIPSNPRSWFVSTGLFKVIDSVRSRAHADTSQRPMALRFDEINDAVPRHDQDIEDDRLRLIFTCCHPALSQLPQVGLTLRDIS